MACAPTGEEGTEAGREAKSKHNKRRRDSLDITTQMGWERWAQIPPPQFPFLKPPSSILPVAFLGFWELNPPSWVLIYQRKAWELLLNDYRNYCSFTFRTFANIKILHFLEPCFFFSAAFLGEEWDGLVSQMGCYSPISVRDLTEPRPLFWLGTLSHVLTRLYPRPNLK